MDSREKSTEWALLFPLKAGLFAVKSSLSSRTINREKERILNEQPIQLRNNMRRGSSLSDLDKLHNQTQLRMLPDIIRSTEKFSGSLPQSPALSRTNLEMPGVVQGSIGDLMNLKKYGGSTWSVKSETLIAKFVPLSTVTPRHSPPASLADKFFDKSPESENNECGRELLTCAQRTQRLIKLIKKQRYVNVLSPGSLKKEIVSPLYFYSYTYFHYAYIIFS